MTAHPEGVCPTISLLKADRALDAMADENDAWGRPLQLSCTDSETEVRSAGADGASGTADDPLEKTASPAPVAIVGTPPRTDLPPGAAHPESVGFAPDAARSLIATHAVACANKGRAAGSALATFSLSIAIRPDGTVNTVHANRGKTTERDPSILGCILKNVAKQNFGSTGKDKDITLEL